MRYLVLCLALLSAAPALEQELDGLISLLELVLEADEETAVSCLDQISQQAQSGELKKEQLDHLKQRLLPTLKPVLEGKADSPLYPAALVLATLWGDTESAGKLRELASSSEAPEPIRAKAIDALASVHDAPWLRRAAELLINESETGEIKSKVLASLGKYESAEVADAVLRSHDRLSADLRPKVIGLLTQRPLWSKRLLAAIEEKQIAAAVLNVNQLRSMLSSSDQELAETAKRLFGAVRTERDPQREALIADMRKFLSTAAGDSARGEAVFQRVCGQCHRIHGVGQEVGPDVTSNGRASFDQLLSNVFDPSLVIGPGYQAVTVVTADGRVLTGLVAEDNEQRVALKLQGGKLEIIARSDIEEVAPSKLSLMPEGLEKQITPGELADLFAFLVLDRPPRDPDARAIPGTPPALLNR